MPLKWHRKVVQCKLEAVYGTDPTAAAADALVIYDMEFERGYDYTTAKRTLPYLARPKTRVANKIDRLRGWVEAGAGGAAGTAPGYKNLLRASSWAEVISVGVDVQYTPISTADESATFVWNMDGQRHRFNGARGVLNGLRFAAGELPRFGFEFLGLPVAPDDTAMVAPDFTAWKDADVVSKVNTPTFTLHGFAAVLQSLEIDMATALAFRDMPNKNDVQATDREPAGTVTIEAPTMAAKNYFSAIDENTLGVMQLIHGVGAGKIVQLDAPKVQLTNPRYSNVDGLAYLTMDLGLDPNAGNDELKITVK